MSNSENEVRGNQKASSEPHSLINFEGNQPDAIVRMLACVSLPEDITLKSLFRLYSMRSALSFLRVFSV